MYIKRILEKFGMQNFKSIMTPLATHFKLLSSQNPKIEDEKKQMKSVPYANTVGSLIYAMICTKPNIAHVVSVVSRFMANPRSSH